MTERYSFFLELHPHLRTKRAERAHPPKISVKDQMIAEILAFVKVNGPSSSAEISEYVGKDRSTINGVLREGIPGIEKAVDFEQGRATLWEFVD